MKTALKVIAIICLIVLLLIVAGIGFRYYVVYHAPMVPEEYWNKVETEADIESCYLGYGNYQIAHIDKKAEEPVNRYIIYYPKELSRDKYPVVVIVNGTDVFVNKEKPLFEHLASWGFIVIGNHDGSTWSGQSADLTLDFLCQHIFYGRRDCKIAANAL